MGSKKKKRESSSSSSSSESDSSDLSSGERSKRKSKKRRDSIVENENVKKGKIDDDRNKNKLREDVEKDNKERKRRHSPLSPSKDRHRKNEETDRKTRDDKGRHEERRTRTDDRNERRYDDRYRNRSDYHDRRDDRERDYRDQRDNREYRNHKNDRERNYRDKREDNRNRDRDRNRDDHRRRRSRSASFDHENARWGKVDDKKSEKDNKPKEKQKPDFGLSGKLTEERNTYRGVVIKYSEPPEARKPKRRWRLYPFKGEKALQTLYIHRESAYLIGRDRKVVDLPVDHPSCSKQHAVLQYRLVPFTREDGSTGKRVRPYLIDLESANGTYINNKKIESKKYVELLEKDVIKFGYSSREYVLLHENSKDEGQDDDVKQEEEVAVKAGEN